MRSCDEGRWFEDPVEVSEGGWIGLWCVVTSVKRVNPLSPVLQKRSSTRLIRTQSTTLVPRTILLWIPVPGFFVYVSLPTVPSSNTSSSPVVVYWLMEGQDSYPSGYRNRGTYRWNIKNSERESGKRSSKLDRSDPTVLRYPSRTRSVQMERVGDLCGREKSLTVVDREGKRLRHMVKSDVYFCWLNPLIYDRKSCNNKSFKHRQYII